MKNCIVLLIFISFSFQYCKPTLTTTGSHTSPEETNSNTSDKRFGRPSSQNEEPDSVVITGAKYIPLYGKREAGVRPELAGTWELEFMEGYTPPGTAPKKLD